MSEFSVTKGRIHSGVWEGVVSGASDQKPEIVVSHLDKPVEFTLTDEGQPDKTWVLKIPIPSELLADGVQVFLISQEGFGEKLADFTILTGEPLEDDIRAETELLRAELDMLKRAFRRHCLETT